MWRRLMVVLLCLVFAPSGPAQGSERVRWRAATAEELEAVLPSRAHVEKEHIETEMRTATGIINNRNQTIAAVVLITAGYAAAEKYSHYLVVQAPMLIDGTARLNPGAYAVGWRRIDAGLDVHFYDSVTGSERARGLARAAKEPRRVESFRIWPPKEHGDIQIGRFFLPYSMPEK